MNTKIILLFLGVFVSDILVASYGLQELIRPHTDIYDITTIYKIQSDDLQRNVSRNPRYYDTEIYLKNDSIGMPIAFNGYILSSEKNSLEFIADHKYANNILTRNSIEYNADEWEISTFFMSNKRNTSSYNLLLWKARNNEESFQINWQQNNTMNLCISVSYMLEDRSKCKLSMSLSETNYDFQIYSYDFKEAKTLTTVLLKMNENDFIDTVHYSLDLKLTKLSTQVKSLNQKYNRYSYSYENEYVTQYATGCKIGIKRIAQCTHKYEKEMLYTIPTEKLPVTYIFSARVFNVYPFENSYLNSLSFQPSTCLNGGYEYEGKCMCPPGFKGNNCDYACGPNRFGIDCSEICSMYKSQCQSMILCTNSFGCTCPAGFTGLYCKLKCENGTYGINCSQKCPEGCNLGTCDIYTGACKKGCKSSYILPDCLQKYPWLEHPPQLEHQDFQSLKLKLNFNLNNINNKQEVNIIYYQIIFKAALNELEFQYMEPVEIGKNKSVVAPIDNLKPGISYTFGVILVSEDGNYNFDDIKLVNYSTLCIFPKNIDFEVKLLSSIDNINVTWNKFDARKNNECKITGYVLKLQMISQTYEQHESYSVEAKTNHNGYLFENLVSGQKYAVKVTAISTSGETKSSEVSYVSTEDHGYVKIKNIKASFTNNQSALIMTWDTEKKYEIPMSFYVKYKVNKYFSCSQKLVISDWTTLTVHNKMEREIWGLIPNTQYIFKIESTVKGYDYNDYENVIFVKTPTSTPKLAPVNDENCFSYITNETAFFNWTINMNECTKLNGLFLGYRVILKNIEEFSQLENNIKQTEVFYKDLKPNTRYELLVYTRTNNGINLEQVLTIPFKTKSEYLIAVEELVVYKKNLKRKSIGIKWSFNDINTINGFIITAIEEESNITKQITVEPEKCVAWPTFYCATFENLIPNNQYKIMVKAKSIDYPTGGQQASVAINFSDGFSDKPENLRVVDVDSQHITLEWDIPWIFNGLLKSFIVNTEEISSSDTDCCDSKPDVEIPVIEEMPTYNYTIYNLKPGSNYSIGVLSKTSFYGQTSNIYVKTPNAVAVTTEWLNYDNTS